MIALNSQNRRDSSHSPFLKLLASSFKMCLWQEPTFLFLRSLTHYGGKMLTVGLSRNLETQSPLKITESSPKFLKGNTCLCLLKNWKLKWMSIVEGLRTLKTDLKMSRRCHKNSKAFTTLCFNWVKQNGRNSYILN